MLERQSFRAGNIKMLKRHQRHQERHQKGGGRWTARRPRPPEWPCRGDARRTSRLPNTCSDLGQKFHNFEWQFLDMSKLSQRMLDRIPELLKYIEIS